MEGKVKAIHVIPSTEEEYGEIKSAAESTKRSLASFLLYSALREARRVKQEESVAQ